MYRLNVQLPDNIGERLCECASSTGLTKVAITTAALDEYMRKQEVQRKLMEKMADPEIFAQMCKTLGFDPTQM